MKIEDYLIEQSGLDFKAVFSDWKEFVPAEFTVWMINKFGDMFLVFEDGSVNLLDVGAGSVSRLADNKNEFADLVDEEDNGSNWFMIPLVDQLIEENVILGSGECYSYKKMPLLGGEYTIDNIETSDIYVHYSVFGQIATQLKDVPDGTKINISIEE